MMKLKADIFGFLFSFDLSIFRKGNAYTEGYNNRTELGLYVTFLDYDNFKLDWLKDELRRLMDCYHLDHFFILQSSKNCFHAVNLEPLKPFKYYMLLRDTSADPNFKVIAASASFRSWVLRCISKGDKKIPSLVGFITSKERYPATVSRAHYLYMRKSGILPDSDETDIHKYLKDNLDSTSNVIVTGYLTNTKRLL